MMLEVILASLLVAGGPSAACEWRSEYISEDASVAVDAQLAATLDPGLSIAEIVEKIGPAKRDKGSGAHVLEWQLADGRRLRVSATDACSRPLLRAIIPGDDGA